MSGLIQLDPWIKVETPLGPGLAVIYESDADEIYWTVFDCKTRAIVQFKNNQILAAPSFSLGLGLSLEDLRNKIARALDNRNQTQ